MKDGATYARRLYRKRQDWLLGYRAALGCVHCGETDFRVLDFHHVGPKNSRLGHKPSKYLGLAHLSEKDRLAELRQCIVLCANCHRREEYEGRLSGD